LVKLKLTSGFLLPESW